MQDGEKDGVSTEQLQNSCHKRRVPGPRVRRRDLDIGELNLFFPNEEQRVYSVGSMTTSIGIAPGTKGPEKQ